MASTVLLLACVILPLLPGRSDPVAVTLSAIVQVLAFAGLLEELVARPGTTRSTTRQARTGVLLVRLRAEAS